MHIVVQEAPFNLAVQIDEFTRAQKSSGAIVCFTGIVRDLPDGGLQHMLIEHYPSMTEKALGDIADQAFTRWALEDVRVIHRYGKFQPGELIMMVATASAHRKSAFEAADFLMDYLKSRAPFWKKEVTRVSEGWVDAKETDEAALNRW